MKNLGRPRLHLITGCPAWSMATNGTIIIQCMNVSVDTWCLCFNFNTRLVIAAVFSRISTMSEQTDCYRVACSIDFDTSLKYLLRGIGVLPRLSYFLGRKLLRSS